MSSHRYKTSKPESGEAPRYEYDTFCTRVSDKEQEERLRIKLNLMAAQGWVVVVATVCSPGELLFVIERSVANG